MIFDVLYLITKNKKNSHILIMSQIKFNMPEGFLSFNSQRDYLGPAKYQLIADKLKFYGKLNEYLYVYVHPSDLKSFIMVKPKEFIISGLSKNKVWRIKCKNTLKKENIPDLKFCISMLMPKESLFQRTEGNVVEIRMNDALYAKKICRTRKNLFFENLFTLGGLGDLFKKNTGEDFDL